MLPVPWQMKIAALAGGALIVLVVAACSSGGNTKTAVPTVAQTATQTSPTISGGGTSSATQTAQPTATQAGATPAAAVDPCTLLTKDEIAAAVSEAVGDGIEATNQAAPTFACEWAHRHRSRIVQEEPERRLRDVIVVIDQVELLHHHVIPQRGRGV